MSRLRLFARLPIRWRLTLAFTVVMAIVLTAVGYLVYSGLQSSLDRSIYSDLVGKADLIKAYVVHSDQSVGSIFAKVDGEQETAIQILSTSGRVLDGTKALGSTPLLDSQEVARAAKATIVVERDIPSVEGGARVLATSDGSLDGGVVIAVATSLDDRDEALSRLLLELVIACPLALLFAAALAYWLATRALRPVEEIRLQAEAVSAQEPGRKLPVPEADDEIAHLSVTLNDMLGRLESSLVRERGFVSNASHELRTPLALVKTEVDLALSRPRSNSELEEALRSIAGEIDRLSQLVDDLLLLARMDEGRLPKRRTRLVGREMFETVRDRFARRAASNGRVIKVDVDPMVWFVGDRQLVLQVLSNLVENALRYGSGTIELTTREAGGNVELHVMDRGPGFPPGFLPTAFDRFSRVHPMKMSGGTGLGLAIVAAIAEAHGGHAGAANRPEGGADVWASLPHGLRVSRRTTFNSGE